MCLFIIIYIEHSLCVNISLADPDPNGRNRWRLFLASRSDFHPCEGIVLGGALEQPQDYHNSGVNVLYETLASKASQISIKKIRSSMHGTGIWFVEFRPEFNHNEDTLLVL